MTPKEILNSQIRAAGVIGSSALLGIALCLLCGCTSFHVTQMDEASDRTVRTDIMATAWFSSAQAIAKIKATTTDRSQSFNSDSIGQQGATNTVEALKAVAHILELIK